MRDAPCSLSISSVDSQCVLSCLSSSRIDQGAHYPGADPRVLTSQKIISLQCAFLKWLKAREIQPSSHMHRGTFGLAEVKLDAS
jgi:hypothetical protein